jgi:hypothetical protein
VLAQLPAEVLIIDAAVYTADIDWILNQGRTQGVRARLRNKLDYLWRSCTGELREQNDLFRLTYALELATQHDWVYHVMDDKQWSGRHQVRLNPGVNTFLCSKAPLMPVSVVTEASYSLSR